MPRSSRSRTFLKQGGKGEKIIDGLVSIVYKNLDFYKTRTGPEEEDKQNIRKRILKRRYFICFNPLCGRRQSKEREGSSER